MLCMILSSSCMVVGQEGATQPETKWCELLQHDVSWGGLRVYRRVRRMALRKT